jgi:hypothetical protein
MQGLMLLILFHKFWTESRLPDDVDQSDVVVTVHIFTTLWFDTNRERLKVNLLQQLNYDFVFRPQAHILLHPKHFLYPCRSLPSFCDF